MCILKLTFKFSPDRFLLSDLTDWMHEVMDKDYQDWKYTRSDLRTNIYPFITAFLLQNMWFGQKWLRAATIDKLERVTNLALFGSVLIW